MRWRSLNVSDASSGGAFALLGGISSGRWLLAHSAAAANYQR